MDKKICNNPACRAENPSTAKYCRKCGSLLFESTDGDTKSTVNEEEFLPYHLRHPEYNLVPYSAQPLGFVFNVPDYVEKLDTPIEDVRYFLWIVKNGKMGIVRYCIFKNGFINVRRIIKCRYDKIEKGDGYFKCCSNSQIIYFDLEGNILK